jgi:hypothetical protein
MANKKFSNSYRGRIHLVSHNCDRESLDEGNLSKKPAAQVGIQAAFPLTSSVILAVTVFGSIGAQQIQNSN